ncbi:hypothetical protein HBI74_215980 [Parastagonospora nodorum]|nr:hypothetical protein HBI74_215980 [Parastagonospora nodorum]
MDRFCTICGFQPKTYAGLAKYTAGCYSRHLAQQSLELSENVHVCAADSLSSTVTVYDHIEKDKNADLAIADGISDALDMCAKDDLIRRKGPLLTSTQTPNHVDTFGLDFAFSFAAWLQRIKCTLGDVDSLFADARLYDLHTRLPFQSGHDIWIQEDIAKTSSLSRLEADQHFFVYQNILSLIAFIISYRNTDYPVRVYHELHSRDWWWNIQQSLLDRATVVPIIISPVYVTIGNLSRKARRQRSTSGTLLAEFIPITKIRDPLLKTNYEEQVLLTGVKKNRYCTRCTRCLDKGHDDFVHLVDYFGWKHYNFNIYVSLATDTLHLLLKGLVMKMLDFMQDMLDDIYPGSRKTWDNSTTLVTQESSSTQLNERFRQVMHSTSLKRFNNKRAFTELVAVVSLLFISKAPFALHFIRAVCDLVTLAQYKSYDEDTLAYIQGALERMNVFKEEFRHALTHIIQDIRMYGALDGICTGANSEAHHITIVKQFYSMINKKEYILQICLHNSRRTALLAADHATVVKQSQLSTTSIPGIQPHSTKLPLSEVAANIAISDFTHAAAIHPFIKCWRSSGKRHNDPEHCDEEVVRCAPNWQQIGLWRRDYVWLYLILTIIDYTRYDKDGKHMAYIGAFSEVLLFNNNGQIDNTTRMLSVRRRAWNAASKRRTLQAFKFYDLSTIIRPVHLVPRDLLDSTTCTTMSYYVNNYID